MSDVTPILSGSKVAQATRWELPKVGRDQRPENPLRPEPPTVAELQRLEDQARQEGFEQGLAEGRALAQRERDAQVARLVTLFDAMARPLADIDTEVEQELAGLAALIARRVVGHAIEREPNWLAPLVRELIAMLPASTQQLRIMLHPDDAALLSTSLSEAGERGWHIDEDATLTRGGFRLESAYSRMDAALETRLAAAIDAFLASDDTVTAGERGHS